ncbi:MAG: hypothetical protein JW809_08360 [Pirellulales bacterium]|nr:hypothetical protein [Pirellulales bacterium]
MRNRFIVAVASVLLLAAAWPSEAVELGRVLGWPRRPAPAWQGNPRAPSPEGQSAGIPGPHRYPEYNQSSPWYGYGFGVPTYSWGWFGATYRPATNCHTGFYGDYYQWGYRRGY